MADWVRGALGAVGGLVGGVLNYTSAKDTNKTNLKIARETNQMQMDLAKYQADQNLNLWNLNNAYNTPSAQMERYKSAGLNPNLMYGQGSSGNSSSPAQGYQSPRLNVPHIENPMPNAVQSALNGLSAISGVSKTLAETDNIHQNTENLQQDNRIKRLEVWQRLMNGAKTQTELKYYEQRLLADLANIDSGTVRNLASGQLADSQRFTIDAMRQVELDYKKAQVENIVQDTIGKKFANSLQPLQKSRLINEIAEIKARTQLSVSNSRYIDEQRAIKEVLRTSGLNLDNDEFDRLMYQLEKDNSAGWLKALKVGSNVLGGAFGLRFPTRSITRVVK